MCDLTPRDLRRLQTLEERLAKAQAECKDLSAERKQLLAAVAASAQRALELVKESADATQQLEGVVAENRSLSTQLDEASRDLERFSRAAGELKENLNSSVARLAVAEASLVAAQAAQASAEKQRDGLAHTLRVANKQLAGKKITPVMPAADVAKLLDELVLGIGANLPGLDVRDGELKLKVAFGEIGGDSGFVMPTATSPPQLRDNLHELSLRFDRSRDVDSPS